MLTVYLHEGSHPNDICDYCHKQTGEEVICLQTTSRSKYNTQSIQIHTKCLVRQINKRYGASNSAAMLVEEGIAK